MFCHFACHGTEIDLQMSESCGYCYQAVLDDLSTFS